MKLALILAVLLSLTVGCSRQSDELDTGSGTGAPARDVAPGSGSER